jgi:hypothetical protein
MGADIMKGLDAHHYAVMDLYQDMIDKEDDQSALADAERLELLDLVIQVQGALVLNQQDIAMCILNQLERELS